MPYYYSRHAKNLLISFIASSKTQYSPQYACQHSFVRDRTTSRDQSRRDMACDCLDRVSSFLFVESMAVTFLFSERIVIILAVEKINEQH